MSSKKIPDTQYVSLAGTGNGREVLLVDWRKPAGETHRIVRQADDPSLLIFDFGVVDTTTPEAYADLHKIPGNTAKIWKDAIKISRVEDAVLNADIIVSDVDSEDCIDITWSRQISFEVYKAAVFGRYLATIKGGSADIALNVFNQYGHGKYYDADLGNWFDYNTDQTRDVSLFFYPVDGSSPTARHILADAPHVFNEKWSVHRPWWGNRKIFIPAMRVAKKLGIA
jgi:hypothetical protein